MGDGTRQFLFIIVSAVIVMGIFYSLPEISIKTSMPSVQEANNSSPKPMVRKTTPLPEKDLGIAQVKKPPQPPLPTRKKLKSQQPDTTYAYQLPYEPNVAYYVTQGFFGKATHSTVHALDIAMPEGTPILCARDGVVDNVVEDEVYKFVDKEIKKYRDVRNIVSVKHDDGTEALYGHIKKGSALVTVGQKVKVGTPLALVGYANGAHLHFAIYAFTPKSRKYKTIPFSFATKQKPKGEVLVAKKVYMRPDSKVAYPTNMIKEVNLWDQNRQFTSTFRQKDRVTLVVDFNWPIELPLTFRIKKPNVEAIILKEPNWHESRRIIWATINSSELKYSPGEWHAQVQVEDQIIETIPFRVLPNVYRPN